MWIISGFGFAWFEAQILQQLWPLNLRPAGSLHGTIKAAGEIHIVERAYADR